MGPSVGEIAVQAIMPPKSGQPLRNRLIRPTSARHDNPWNEHHRPSGSTTGASGGLPYIDRAPKRSSGTNGITWPDNQSAGPRWCLILPECAARRHPYVSPVSVSYSVYLHGTCSGGSSTDTAMGTLPAQMERRSAMVGLCPAGIGRSTA